MMTKRVAYLSVLMLLVAVCWSVIYVKDYNQNVTQDLTRKDLAKIYAVSLQYFIDTHAFSNRPTTILVRLGKNVSLGDISDDIACPENVALLRDGDGAGVLQEMKSDSKKGRIMELEVKLNRVVNGRPHVTILWSGGPTAIEGRFYELEKTFGRWRVVRETIGLSG
jgi:hypothetical protein